MADEPQVEAVRRLLRLVERYRLAELEVIEAGLKVTIRGPAPAACHPTAHPDPPPEATEPRQPQPPAPASQEEPAHPHPERLHDLVSPMTGTFYRAEAPEHPPLVEPGQLVEEGQSVGLIEAMKVFSTVPADRAGRVIEFKARNGSLVHEGDALLVIEVPG